MIGGYPGKSNGIPAWLPLIGKASHLEEIWVEALMNGFRNVMIFGKLSLHEVSFFRLRISVRHKFRLMSTAVAFK